MSIDLITIQRTIGYTFKNVDLLQQAFVRRSYSEENGGQNNEVLEFIGDKALDLAVIKIMMERFGVITDDKDFSEFKLRNPKYFKTIIKEGKFTDIKKDLVQKKALANAMDSLGFHTLLIMGRGDINQGVENQDSVKEDLFEAIIGAVTIDSKWDLEIITDVVSRMIDFESYFNNEDTSYSNFVGMLQEWSQKNGYGLPEYRYFNQIMIRFNNAYYCEVEIKGLGMSSSGNGSSEAKARMDAAKNLYEKLVNYGYVLNEYKEAVGEADYDRALAQINELVQKNMISKPIYEFEQSYDGNGNPIWTCRIIIEEVEYYYENTSRSKKEAQKKCAYDMLVFLMDEEEE